MKSNFVYPRISRFPLVGHDSYIYNKYMNIFMKKILVCETVPRFDLTSLRQKVSMLPTESPELPYVLVFSYIFFS